MNPIDNEETATHYCKLTGNCCICWYNRKVCFDGKSKEDDDERN